MELRRQRLYSARLQGLRSRLIQEWRLPAERADRLLTAWKQEATQRGLTPDDFAYWRDAPEWIAGSASKRDSVWIDSQSDERDTRRRQ
jgi:hypothetical protein